MKLSKNELALVEAIKKNVNNLVWESPRNGRYESGYAGYYIVVEHMWNSTHYLLALRKDAEQETIDTQCEDTYDEDNGYEVRDLFRDIESRVNSLNREDFIIEATEVFNDL